MNPLDNAPVPSDTVIKLLLTAGSSVTTQDYPSGAQIMRVTAMSTSGGDYMFSLNAATTGAAAPSSGLTTGTSAASMVINSTPVLLQITGAATGFSCAGGTSGWAILEFWKK
jgi:hypothetical protein